MKYVYWKDIANRVVFVRDGRIVYHEDEFYSEHVPSGHVGFELPAKSEYLEFTSSARFVGRVERIDGRRYYVLTPETPEQRN
jgi:hypothetical protein